MSYNATYTTYGNKTTDEIAALTGMQVGDSVFNTDYSEVEWYSGSTWLSNNSIQMVTSVVAVEGRCVYINASGLAAFLNGSSVTYPYGIGVVQYGGAIGSTIAVRICGIARVQSLGGQTIDQYARASGVNGQATNAAAPTTGCIGRNLNGSGSALFYCYLSFIERA